MVKKLETSTQLRNLNGKVELITSVSKRLGVQVEIIIKSHLNLIFWVEIYLIVMAYGEQDKITELEEIIL